MGATFWGLESHFVRNFWLEIFLSKKNVATETIACPTAVGRIAHLLSTTTAPDTGPTCSLVVSFCVSLATTAFLLLFFLHFLVLVEHCNALAATGARFPVPNLF
jgi:hypothetical protein